MTCLYGSLYSHTADIYTVTETNNKQTGQKIRTWTYSDSIECNAKPVNTTGKSLAAGEVFAKLYEAYSYIRIKTPVRVDISSKITNIKSDDNVMWMEDDGEPTVFEVSGVVPVMDIFNSLMGYELLCNRSSDQRINP